MIFFVFVLRPGTKTDWISYQFDSYNRAEKERDFYLKWGAKSYIVCEKKPKVLSYV